MKIGIITPLAALCAVGALAGFQSSPARSDAIAAQKARLKIAALADAADVRAFNIDGSRMNAPADGGGLAGAPIQEWSFEPAPASPAFVPGPLNGQNGWLAFTGGATSCSTTPNTDAPVVSSTAPALSGAQWVDIPKGPCIEGTFNGPFGPTSPAQPAGQYTLRCKIRISNTGGADYDIIPQTPSQGFIAARMKFFFGDIDPDGTGPLTPDGLPGDILVVTDPDGAGPGTPVFVDSGVDYTPNVTHDVRIELDGPAGTLKYFLDGAEIFSGNLVAATSMEQVVIPSDNFHEPNEKGQIDDLVIELGVGTPCPADTDGSGAVDVDDLIAVILGWGPCAGCPPASCPSDIDNSCATDVDDLIGVILGWGACP